MGEPVRILLVEDSDDDAALMLAALRNSGYEVSSERVETAPAFVDALARGPWEIVLCDYSLPRFGALAALELAQQSGSRAPFIVISGSVSEQLAVAALRAGVDDYVMKDNLIRLGPTVTRALRDHRARLERERAEQALLRSQRDYEALINHVDGIVWEAEAQTFRFTFVSRQAARILGYPVERWIGEPAFWIEHVHPDDRQWTRNFCASATAQMQPHELEYRMIAADGRVVWLQDLASVVVEDGRAVKLRGIMVDCTARKLADERLREAEERYRGIFENAVIGLFRSTPEGRYLDANPALARMFGYDTPAQMIGSVSDIAQQQVAEHAARKEFAQQFATTGRIERFVGEGVRKDGSRLWVSMTAHAVRDAQGRVSHVEGSAKDVTDQVAAQNALREAEERYRSIFENSLEGIWRSTPEGRFVDANPALARMLGYESPAALIAQVKSIQDELYFDPRQFVAFREAIGREGRARDFDVELRRRDGSTVWASLSARALLDDSGAIAGLEGVAEDISERKRALEALSETEQRYRQLFDVQSDAQLIVDAASERIEDANHAAIAKLGYSREALLSLRLSDVVPDEPVVDELLSAGHDGAARPVHPVRRDDGAMFPAEISSASFVAAQRRKVIVALADVGVRLAQEERIERLRRIRDVLGEINACIVRATTRRELAADVCRVAVGAGRFGVAWFGELDGRNGVLAPIAAEGVDEELRRDLEVRPREEDSERARTIARALDERRPSFVNNLCTAQWPERLRARAIELDCDAMVCLPLVVGGEVVATLVLYARGSLFGDDEELRLLGEVASDISFALDHLEKSERLNYLAYYDVLTGLPNRALFVDRLTQHLQAAASDDSTRAVVLFDLQRFRHVNETLGRHAGDTLLKAVAGCAADAFARGATLARVGGDVFALAFADARDTGTIAQLIDHTLMGCFASPFAMGPSELRIGARAGVAIYPHDGRDAETLLRNAEAALKQAKQNGSRYLFYAPAMNARIATALRIEHKLRRAIDHGELVLHYQPQVSAVNGRVMGFEALVRWQTPDQGLWLPGRFVPIAEELGLIVDLGRWVLHAACRQAGAWLDAGFDEFTIGVNVSALQLKNEGFIGEVRTALEAHALPNHLIELELTESAIMEQIDRMSDALHELKALGLSIALDDFGVGYSSLHFLKRLPIDKLKIDQSFVREITTNQGDAAIVRAIVAMGHQLRLKVVAEGVETAAQFGYLRRNHCDECQGRFFGMAQPAAEAERILRQRYLNPEAFTLAPQAQTLLLLDDDAHVLHSLVRLLRRDGYRIITTTSAPEAFAILGREDIQVVVSDQRMPDTSGTEFLNSVKDMYPDTIRMVLSGFTDLKSVTEAINRGAIYKFLTKPWDGEELRAQIREAFRTYAERRANSRAA